MSGLRGQRTDENTGGMRSSTTLPQPESVLSLWERHLAAIGLVMKKMKQLQENLEFRSYNAEKIFSGETQRLNEKFVMKIKDSGLSLDYQNRDIIGLVYQVGILSSDL